MGEFEKGSLFFSGLKLSSQRKLALCKDFHNDVPTSLQDLLHLYKEVRLENKTFFFSVCGHNDEHMVGTWNL